MGASRIDVISEHKNASRERLGYSRKSTQAKLNIRAEENSDNVISLNSERAKRNNVVSLNSYRATRTSDTVAA